MPTEKGAIERLLKTKNPSIEQLLNGWKLLEPLADESLAKIEIPLDLDTLPTPLNRRFEVKRLQHDTTGDATPALGDLDLEVDINRLGDAPDIDFSDKPVADDIETIKLVLAKAEQDELGIEMLKKSLQAAIEIEFATIPPYLCALWSIKDELHPVAKSIREIVHEEMLHMAFGCNMLASIGGQPKLVDSLVKFPGRLPAGIHPNLIVTLAGLTRKSLEVFLTIERPGVIPGNVEKDKLDEQPAELLIGQFYDQIYTGFQTYKPAMHPDRQITGRLSWMVIKDLENVRDAISLIKRQGEGSISGPVDSSKKDLAHYFRFKEIYRGQKLEFDPKDERFVYGSPINFPDVWPMDVVPPGGYRKQQVHADVWHLLNKFDETFSNMVRLLESAWGEGGQAAFLRSTEAMFELEKYGKSLMQLPIAGKGGKTYGPCFRYIQPKPVANINQRATTREPE